MHSEPWSCWHTVPGPVFGELKSSALSVFLESKTVSFILLDVEVRLGVQL